MIELWVLGSEPICGSIAESNGPCGPGAADSCNEIRKFIIKYLIINIVFLGGPTVMMTMSTVNTKLKQYILKR